MYLPPSHCKMLFLTHWTQIGNNTSTLLGCFYITSTYTQTKTFSWITWRNITQFPSPRLHEPPPAAASSHKVFNAARFLMAKQKTLGNCFAKETKTNVHGSCLVSAMSVQSPCRSRRYQPARLGRDRRQLLTATSASSSGLCGWGSFF